MRSIIRLIAVIGIAVLMQGCATIITSSTHTLTVNTDPPGAMCSVTRNNEQIGAVAQTPAQMSMSKGFRALQVDCKKDGHIDADTSLGSSFQPITLGNIILGGGIGVLVDAVSGAMMQYPKSVDLSLVPVTFPSTSARDEYFLARVAKIEADAGKATDGVKARCQPPNCDAPIAQIESDKKRQLDLVDTWRKAVTVKE